MADLTASMRLTLDARGIDRIKRARAAFRNLGEEVEHLKLQQRQAAVTAEAQRRLGMVPRPTLGQRLGGSLGLQQARGALQVAGNLSLAAGAMRQFQGQLESVVRGPIERFAAFDRTMAMTAGRMGEVTDSEIADMRNAAQELGSTTMLSAQQGAEGMFELAGAGLNAAQSIAALPQVGALAEAQMMGLGDATQVSISTMNQFGLEIKDIGRITDVLNTSANSAAISFGDVREAMTYAGQQSKAAGLSLEHTGAMIALVGNAGLRGSIAGTGLAMMLMRLSQQAPAAAKGLRQVGMSGKDLAAGVEDPIGFLDKLNKAMEAKNLQRPARLKLMTTIFGARAAKTALALSEAGQEEFDKMLVKMQAAEGATASMADRMRKSGAGQLKLFESQVESLKIQLGEGLMPALGELMKSVKPVLQDFAKWAKANPRLVSSLGRLTIVGAGLLAVLVPMTTALSTAVTLFGVAGPAARLLTLPLRGVGAAASAASAKMAATNTAAGAAGAGLVKFGAAASALVAGWELGKLFDNLIGKLFDLRDGLLSTELALQMGESKGFNNFISDVGEFFGSDTLKDIAAGNEAANKIKRTTERGTGIKVASKVDVQIHDNRVDSTITTPDSRTTKRQRTGSNI